MQGAHEWVGLQDRAPEVIDGLVRLPCRKRDCGKWNVYRVEATPGTAVVAQPPVSALSIEQRISTLPEDQQRAVIALAGGLGVTATAVAIGVTRRTINRWTKEEEFAAVRRAIAPSISGPAVHSVLEAFYAVVAKDKKKGVAHNMRWFLSRTLPAFRDFEQQKAAAGGTNVSLTVSQQQAQASTQAAVDKIWEDRRAGAVARKD